ncbi:MAG TPA: helix-turn-helix domain-containing protein [Chloroflexota bacterium]
MDEQFVSVAAAAKLLGVHTATIRRWVDSGTLRAYRLGPRRLLLKREDLERLITPAHHEPATMVDMRQQDATPLRPLTPEEKERALAAMETARQLAAEIRARRGGKLFSPSWAILNESRDARSRERQ